VVTLFEWLNGLLTPDMCDMARPTWLDDADDEAGVAPLLADKATTVPDDDDDDVTDPPNVKPSLPPSLDFRGPEADKRAFSVSESSTRSDGKSNSCCLSANRKWVKKIVHKYYAKEVLGSW
jgi:hypothetical protein